MPDARVMRPARGANSTPAGKTKSRQQRNSTDERQGELFEKAGDTPALPKRGTLPWQLLLHLLTGASVTHPEWEDITGSWRLAASVDVLRVLGWPVLASSVPAPTPENPARVIARYRMVRVGIEAGRELLRQARRTAAAKEGAAE